MKLVLMPRTGSLTHESRLMVKIRVYSFQYRMSKCALCCREACLKSVLKAGCALTCDNKPVSSHIHAAKSGGAKCSAPFSEVVVGNLFSAMMDSNGARNLESSNTERKRTALLAAAVPVWETGRQCTNDRHTSWLEDDDM